MWHTQLVFLPDGKEEELDDGRGGVCRRTRRGGTIGGVGGWFGVL